MALGIEALDDFVASYLQKYIMGKWQDISLPLQEYMFASRLFDKANKREMSTSQCKWKIKVRQQRQLPGGRSVPQGYFGSGQRPR